MRITKEELQDMAAKAFFEACAISAVIVVGAFFAVRFF